MSPQRALVALALAGLVAVIGSGCASPMPSGRHGLLESVDQADHSRRSNRFVALERTPVTRAASQRKHFSAIEPDSEGEDGEGATVRRAGSDKAVAVEDTALHWPLRHVTVTSPFGKRGKEFHEGIDLKAPTGTPVYAAQDGTVIYSGSKIRGYGRMVVIRHVQTVSTIYAHNSKLLVRVGQYVRRGQKIAISGKSGHVSGPHVHFEVRDGLAALDPLELLPKQHAGTTTAVIEEPIVEASAPKVAAAAAVAPKAQRRSQKPAKKAKYRVRAGGGGSRNQRLAQASRKQRRAAARSMAADESEVD